MDVTATGTSATKQTEREQVALAEAVFSRRNCIIAAVLFMVALLSLWAFEIKFHIGPFSVSDSTQFLHQAQSFLHGRWDIDLPASVTDVVVINGKHYIIYPPFPAVVFMPFVALFGLNTSDVLITAIFSAANLSLLYLLFEQVRANGLTRRVWIENLCIALLLYYGSISLWLSLGGRVWFTAHIICFTCTLLSLLLAFRRHFGWSALLLGCAFFSRGTVLMGFPLLFYLAWQNAGSERSLESFLDTVRSRTPDWSRIPWRRLLAPALVTAGIAVLYMVHNWVLFGAPLETGYNIIIPQHYPQITQGVFNIRYVPANFIANFFSFPRIIFSGPYDRHPAIDMLNGGVAVSVFFTTPLFLFLFWRNRRFSLLRAILWLTLGLIVAQMLLFHAAGWYQFGTRYLFDGYAYAFLLLALTDTRVDWRFALLGTVGIIINILGAFQFWTSIIPHV